MGGTTSKEKLESDRLKQLHDQRILEENRRLDEERRVLLQQIFEQQRRLEQKRLLEDERERILLREKEEEERRLERQETKKKMRFVNRLNKREISENLPLLNDLRRAFGLSPLIKYPTKAYDEVELEIRSSEYITVQKAFQRSNKPYFQIEKIIKIQNPFNILHYGLMKEKYCEWGEDVEEMCMFHGTKMAHLDDICTYNFDRSKVKTHKFGWGVSFARDAYYATHYHHDNKKRIDKVMIYVKILLGEVRQGNQDTIVPDAPCYTTTNEDKTVYVKYDDASTLPLYIVHYQGMHPVQTNYRRNRQRMLLT